MGVRDLINSLLKKFEKDFKTLNRIEVSRSAILNNYDYFKDKTELDVWPVLKSNAYGHGIGEVARILRKREFKYYVADSYFESLKIHEAVPGRGVLLIGYTHPSNYKNMKMSNLALTVYDADTVKALAALGRDVRLHVCIDTGMGRLGVRVNELADFIKFINKYPKLEIEGVWSHFADADGQDDSYTRKQLEEFRRAREILRLLIPEIKYVHLSNTAGTDYSNQVRKNSNSMRLGLGLYGLHPRAQVGFNENLSPALRFVATIINKKTLPKGECVSYGCTYTAPKDMEIGVVSAGYYDGVDRRLSNRGHFVYKGQELPILGRVCMNLTIVDLTGVDTKIGDEIEILGIDRDKQNWVRKVSDMCETIPYDILVGLAESIRRVLVD